MTSNTSPFELFLVTTPGLEGMLATEATEAGFKVTGQSVGGVTLTGGWPDVWRANLQLRGAGKVLARIAAFPAVHLAQLDKRATTVPWKAFLRRDVPVRVEAACRKSKIYHSGAAAQRVSKAIEASGITVHDDAEVTVMARIEDNMTTISIDTSGELLHRRGSKQAMAKAPLRETIAAMILRQCGYTGSESVIDPLCGSGTFVIEAAEIAAGLMPGRNRGFAFEKLRTFDAAAWTAMLKAQPPIRTLPPGIRFHGFDRDAGAIKSSTANATRAGVSHLITLSQQPITALLPPEGPPGLIIMNPPYGTRMGEARKLTDLYQTIGDVMRKNFAGWRVGLVTSNTQLARTTKLPFKPQTQSILHGGLRVTLFQTAPLG
jgi:putative N6-adenine-specific DNA methylase